MGQHQNIGVVSEPRAVATGSGSDVSGLFVRELELKIENCKMKIANCRYAARGWFAGTAKRSASVRINLQFAISNFQFSISFFCC